MGLPTTEIHTSCLASHIERSYRSSAIVFKHSFGRSRKKAQQDPSRLSLCSLRPGYVGFGTHFNDRRANCQVIKSHTLLLVRLTQPPMSNIPMSQMRQPHFIDDLSGDYIGFIRCSLLMNKHMWQLCTTSVCEHGSSRTVPTKPIFPNRASSGPTQEAKERGSAQNVFRSTRQTTIPTHYACIVSKSS